MKWILSAIGVVTLGCGAKFAWDEHENLVLFHQQEAVDRQILAEMRRQFPLGMPRAQVVSDLKDHSPDVYDQTLDIDIWLAHEPSFVWYCNFMAPFVEFKFQSQSPSAPLIGIKRETTGECL